MYAKLFSSLYQGTLRGCSDEILVFTNLLAHADSTGLVDKHWRAISEETGINIKRVKAAILNLESADPESRSPEMDGRRIVPIDEHRAWGWQIVNHGKYRAIRNEDDRREQNRLAQQKWREKQKVSKVSRVSQDKPKQKQQADTKEEEEVKKEEAATPLAPTGDEMEQSPFDHPAVVLYQEKFGVNVSRAFAKEIGEHVQNLPVWNRLITEKIAFASGTTDERQKIARWFLKAYFEKVEGTTNGTTKQSYQDRRGELAKQSYDRESEIRRRVTERDRKLSGATLLDSGGQLQLVEPNADRQREGG